MDKLLCVILVAGVAGSGGCDREDSPGALADRVEAALAISNSPQKDQALQQVAEDAAEAGEGEIVRKALSGMNNGPQRDQAAQQCAHSLAKAGRRSEAVEIAKMIANSPQRDQLLQQLSQ